LKVVSIRQSRRSWLSIQVRINGWGGPVIRGRVVRVDPAGFLKVSAHGIEEQRVRVTIDFADPPEAWSRLGHDYRVIAHVADLERGRCADGPVSALFRKDDERAVFALEKKAASIDRIKVIEALETGISIDAPSGKVTIDPPTHHCVLDVHIAEVSDKKLKVLEDFAQQKPADTAAVCDLIKNPNDNQQYVIKI
jgi:hypothetical protein